MRAPVHIQDSFGTYYVLADAWTRELALEGRPREAVTGLEAEPILRAFAQTGGVAALESLGGDGWEYSPVVCTARTVDTLIARVLEKIRRGDLRLERGPLPVVALPGVPEDSAADDSWHYDAAPWPSKDAMKEPFVVEGRVTIDDEPAANLALLLTTRTGEVRQITTDDLGVWREANVPGAEYHLRRKLWDLEGEGDHVGESDG